MDLAKLIGLTNVGLWGWATWLLVTRQDSQVFWSLLVVGLIVDLAKHFIGAPRPPGATGCDALGIKGKSTSFGMPSGHVATAVVGWSLFAAKYFGKDKAPIAAILSGILMGWARSKVGCHTPLQSLAGGILGWLFVLKFTKL